MDFLAYEATAGYTFGVANKSANTAREPGESEDDLSLNDTPPKRVAFVRDLLGWYEREKRVLPWRETRDPYAIWVSEMMLQQTQVATVMPYWARWMEQFPTALALADAPLDNVLKAWQGLGYYARARNMHRAAQIIRDDLNGAFPQTLAGVLALPGVGRYTAGAVCSIALGLDAPIVDANVIRVLCRVFGVPGDPKAQKTQARLWGLAQDLIPLGRASEFNQGMMELGALVCQARPRCSACPVRDICTAFASGDPASFPHHAPRPVFTSQTDVSAVLTHPLGDGRIVLVRRAPGGLWGGLWEMPRVTLANDETPTMGATRAIREIVGLDAGADPDALPLATHRHGVTTRKITLLAVACAPRTAQAEPAPVGCAEVVWITPDDARERLAVSSPQAHLLEKLGARTPQPSLF